MVGWRMKRYVVAMLAVLALAASARAQTLVNCQVSPNALAILAQSGTMTSAGNPYEIEGECGGPVALTSPGVALQTAATGAAAIQIVGNVTISAPDITLGAQGLVTPFVIAGSDAPGPTGITIFGDVTGIVLNDVTVEDFPGSGVSAGGPGSLFIEGGQFIGNANCGLFLFGGMQAELDSNVTVTGNGNGTSSSLQCGIDVEDNAVLFVTSANVDGNLKGPALRIFQAVGDITGGTFQADPSVTTPAIVLENAKVSIVGATIAGTGQSDVIFAVPGTSIILQNSSVTESDANDADATIRLGMGSALLSLGGNVISNSASGGSALVVNNSSSFRQQLETNLGVATAADTITGAGEIEVESNIELGTGAATPSTWNGSIDAAQNSSVRMDGGITVNGSVTLAQASNGFFNLANTGTNVITGGVLCPFTTNQAAHATASATTAQLGNGSAAVTFGSAPNDCLKF